MNYRTAKLKEFCDSKSFNAELNSLLSEFSSRVDRETTKHFGNFKNTGLVGLSNACLEKALRFYGYVVEDKKGKGKLNDEVEDLLAFSIYSVIYLRMLKKQEVENAQHKQDVRDT